MGGPSNPVTLYARGGDGSFNPVAGDPATGQLIVQLAAAPTIDIGKVELLGDDATTIAGTKADVASVATDATPATWTAIFKQISKSLQAIATSAGSLVTGTVLAAGSALIGKVGIDQTTPGTTNGMVEASAAAILAACQAATPAGANIIGAVTGLVPILATATVTCPSGTPTYALGQLVANSATAGSVTPMSFAISRATGKGGMVRRVRMRKTGTGITNANFRLHLYKGLPTCSNGDNAAWLTDNAANYVGSLDVTFDKVFTDGASGNGTPNVGSEINFTSDTYYGLIEARASYVRAASEVFTCELEVLPN